MRRSPVSYVWRNMLSYGTGYGVLFSVTLAVIDLAEIYFGPPPPFIPFHMFIVFCGFFLSTGIGAVFGMVTGLCSGLAMWWITKGYGNPKNILEYRLSVGLATAFVTTLIFLPLFFYIPSIQAGDAQKTYIVFLLFSIGVAVYASQRTATKYLIDIGTTTGGKHPVSSYQ